MHSFELSEIGRNASQLLKAQLGNVDRKVPVLKILAEKTKGKTFILLNWVAPSSSPSTETQNVGRQLWCHHSIWASPLPDNVWYIQIFSGGGEVDTSPWPRVDARNLRTAILDPWNTWIKITFDQIKCTAQWPEGKPPLSKSEELSEKYQRTFDPQPLFWNSVA